MLPLWLSPSLGVGSFNSGTAAANPTKCADSPDSVMKDMIGSTCDEHKVMGKCDSSDELVASLMAKHCAMSCTDCIPSRMTYAGGTNGGTMMCKEIESGCDDPDPDRGGSWTIGVGYEQECIFDFCLSKLP